MASTRWGKRALTGLVGICTAVPVVATFRHYFVNMAFVEGPSMQPTLCEADKAGKYGKELVLINKMAKVRQQFTRGDVVALWSPLSDSIIVKRLVGVSGDFIPRRDDGKWEAIPKGHCWVEGDNAADSTDSEDFGAVPLALLEGRVFCAVWPLTRARLVKSSVQSGRKIVYRG